MNFLHRNSMMSHLFGSQGQPPLQSHRTYYGSTRLMSTATPPSSSTGPASVNSTILEAPKMQPSALDKIFLRWAGLIKKGEPIPPTMSGSTIMKARSFARIRINIGFLLIGAGFSYLMIRSGRAAVKRGESMEKANLEWHRQVNEEYKKEQATK